MKIVYIDAQNIHKSLQVYHDWTLDWKRFYIFCTEKFQATEIKIFFWYVPKYRHLYESLGKIGYTVIFKETLMLPNGDIKWNVDIDIAIIAVRDTYEWLVTRALLITGDGDYNSLISFWQEKWIFDLVLIPGVKNSSTLLTRTAWKRIFDIALLKNKLQKDTKKPRDESLGQ